MSDDFEERLSKALRPIAPTDGFTDRVIARVGNEAVTAKNESRILGVKRADTRRAPHLRSHLLRWFPVALAASAVLSIAVVQQVREREMERGIEARRQLLEALRVTSDTLDAAYHAVNSEQRGATADNSGA